MAIASQRICQCIFLQCCSCHPSRRLHCNVSVGLSCCNANRAIMFGMKIYITDLCIRSPAIKLLSVLKYSQPKSWRHRQTIYSSQKYSTAELRCHLWEQLFLTGIFSSSIAMSSASANLRLTKIFFCWFLMSSSSSDVHITGLYCRIIAISLSP